MCCITCFRTCGAGGRMRGMKRAISIATPLLLLALWPAMAAACPNCKDAVAATDAVSATQVGAAFNYSIFAILGGVVVTAGFVGRTLYKAARASQG